MVLKEEKPGWFANDPSPYQVPMAIRCEVEEVGEPAVRVVVFHARQARRTPRRHGRQAAQLMDLPTGCRSAYVPVGAEG